jgi:hypothetical protein
LSAVLDGHVLVDVNNLHGLFAAASDAIDGQQALLKDAHEPRCRVGSS